MRTYQVGDERQGKVLGFQVDNIYLGPGRCARILSTVEGVSDVRLRRLFSAWDEIHIRFRFKGTDCVVWEPHGDSSRYWIGQPDGSHPVDMGVIELAFKNYEPPMHRKLIGDILTLHVVKKLLGRDDAWRRVNPPPP
jgi:hypothetical protein